jgi:hypothetical protein
MKTYHGRRPLAEVLGGHTRAQKPTRSQMLRRIMRQSSIITYRITLRDNRTPESLLGPYEIPTRKEV